MYDELAWDAKGEPQVSADALCSSDEVVMSELNHMLTMWLRLLTADKHTTLTTMLMLNMKKNNVMFCELLPEEMRDVASLAVLSQLIARTNLLIMLTHAKALKIKSHEIA